MAILPYTWHLNSSNDLVTTYEATRAGFVALALEKNRRATPFVAKARALQEAASRVSKPIDLLKIKGIEIGLLTAAGLSDKAITHLEKEDKIEAVNELIKNYLEPAGSSFVEELIFRFLLTSGDTLGGSMRNVGGALAQRKLTRAVLSTLSIAGIKYQWRSAQSKKWIDAVENDPEIEVTLRGLFWQKGDQKRTLLYNLTVPLIKNNVDLCLFDSDPKELEISKYSIPKSYLALGELKGGIDPAGADEHWKTGSAALKRIRDGFDKSNYLPSIFFIGAAIEKKMADEIWSQLKEGTLNNAANLNEEKQVVSLSSWLCSF
jgi:hypothetical protein